MKPNELRIGNFVKYNGIVVKIDEILSPKPYLDTKFRDKWSIGLFDGASSILCTIDDIEPIELDAIWSEKFGFTDLNSEIQENGGEIFIELKNKEVGICGPDSCTSGMIFYAKCQFVHHFQNIVTSLTGKELELSPLESA